MSFKRVFKKLDLLRIIYRSFYIQGSWNYERMLSLGYCFCMIPGAKRLFTKKSTRAAFLKRSLNFFNTNPYMANWIIGAVLNFEEEATRTKGHDFSEIERFKQRISTVAAAIGDQLFWRLLKPISAIIGLMISFYSKTIGISIFLIFYNLPQMFMRIKGLFSGYENGFGIVKEFSRQKYEKPLAMLNNVGAFLVGVLLIFFGNLQFDGNGSQLIAFLIGTGSMYLFLKARVMVPLALILLIALSVITGFLHSAI